MAAPACLTGSESYGLFYTNRKDLEQLQDLNKMLKLTAKCDNNLLKRIKIQFKRFAPADDFKRK